MIDRQWEQGLGEKKNGAFPASQAAVTDHYTKEQLNMVQANL